MEKLAINDPRWQTIILPLQTAVVYKKKDKLKELLEKHEVFLRNDMVNEGLSSYDLYNHYLKEYTGDSRSNAFVTINWKPGTTPEHTVGLLSNVIGKKWVKKVFWSYEQRGTDEDSMGSGYHNHLLFLNVDKPKSQIQREIYNTVKNHVGNKFHVDVRMIPDSWVNDKKDYMRGDKWDDDKALKVSYDKPFRLKYGLIELYEA